MNPPPKEEVALSLYVSNTGSVSEVGIYLHSVVSTPFVCSRLTGPRDCSSSLFQPIDIYIKTVVRCHHYAFDLSVGFTTTHPSTKLKGRFKCRVGVMRFLVAGKCREYL